MGRNTEVSKKRVKATLREFRIEMGMHVSDDEWAKIEEDVNRKIREAEAVDARSKGSKLVRQDLLELLILVDGINSKFCKARQNVSALNKKKQRWL
jgi:hypothetical protein